MAQRDNISDSYLRPGDDARESGEYSRNERDEGVQYRDRTGGDHQFLEAISLVMVRNFLSS